MISNSPTKKFKSPTDAIFPLLIDIIDLTKYKTISSFSVDSNHLYTIINWVETLIDIIAGIKYLTNYNNIYMIFGWSDFSKHIKKSASQAMRSISKTPFTIPHT
jgi:hypothetical protein